MKKALIYSMIVLGGYLVLGYFLHLLVFPEAKPDLTGYFEPGDVFYSKEEGVHQTIVKHEEGIVYSNLVVEPFAMGPPKHIHTKFDEFFEVMNGELTIWLDGETRTLRPGEVLHVPKGMPHGFYNETPDTIYFRESFPFPEKFAFTLSQAYALMDNDPDFGKMPKTLFMIVPLQVNGLDSYIVEGPPVFVQKALGFLLTPLSRIMGYRSYYPEYDYKTISGNK
jgi:quercetin dioxygenase-like cupin family protein